MRIHCLIKARMQANNILLVVQWAIFIVVSLVVTTTLACRTGQIGPYSVKRKEKQRVNPRFRLSFAHCIFMGHILLSRHCDSGRD